MKKTDFINVLQEKLNTNEDIRFTKKDTDFIINAFTEAITDALIAGDTVLISGFGTFSVKNRPSRIGTNPKTGEPIEIAARLAPHFKAGNTLKAAINV